MSDFTLRSIIARQRNNSGGKRHYWLKRALVGVTFLGGAIFLAILIFLLSIVKDLPSLKNIHEIILAESSIIYDRNGEELYTIHGDENREIVPIEKIPDTLILATLSIEDSQFYEHGGFSFKGIIKAVLSEILNFGSHARGGSTLTQQFVKNAFLTNEKTYTRKLKELILSLQIEWKFSKDEILGMYLNSIPYGSNAYGVERASQMFFGKSVNELSLEESIILASLPQAPSYYFPYGEHVHTKATLALEEIKTLKVSNYEEFLNTIGEDALTWGLLPTDYILDNGATIRVPGRTTLVLNRMVELGFLSKEDRDRAEGQLAQYEFKKYKTAIAAPHFVLYVRDLLEQKYGKEFVQAGGLKIYTTLDRKLQEFAEITVKEQVEKNVERYGANNAALVSAVPKTGEIIAMVGSRDYWNDEIDGKVNVVLQRRLPGSSFKPFAYAAAFSSGYAPASVVYDLETDFGNNYKPKNFDGSFHGPITLRKALGNSLNIPAIKAGMLGGLQKTYDIARGMGLSFPKEADWYGGALPLGVAEVRPIDMLQAYATFANLGERVELSPIVKVEDKYGNILMSYEPKGQQVLDKETAYLITDVLADPEARGSGWNSMLQLPGRKNAVKTGTSNKRKDDKVLPLDGWVAGYTPELTTIVWTGNNDGSPMNQAGSGFSNAGPIWRAFMIEALKDVPASDFEKPAGITTAVVSTLTGKLPTPNFPKGLIRKDVFSTLNLPTEYDTSLKFIKVDRVSGKLPNDFTPEDAQKEIAILQVSSERPLDPNWEEPVQRWAQKSAAEYLKALGVDEVLAEAPTEISTIHTQNNTQEKPEISISSPVNYGSVGGKGVGVWVDIDSKNGIAMVEYYLNDQLVDTKRSAPYKGDIIFPDGTKAGDSFVIKAKAYDTVYNASSSTITVKVAEDTQPPVTEIIYPKEGDTISASSVISIQTNTYDVKSDIEKVVFYFDDTVIAEVKQAPYATSFTVPNTSGKHRIKAVAFDQTSNSAENEISVLVSIARSSTSLEVKVPSTVSFGDSVAVEFSIPSKDIADIAKVELISRFRTKDGIPSEDVVLMKSESLQENATGIFNYRWIRPLQGEYDVFVKASYKSGKVLFSQKQKVTVQ